MPTINAPAQRVELLLDGEWLDVTTAARGFAQPTKRIEEETGRPLTDQLRLRLIVPLLAKLDLTPAQLEQSEPLYLRLTLFDTGEGNSVNPLPPWFFGRVVELNRCTELTAGDLLDLTAHDLLDAANEVAPPGSLCAGELLRYDEVLEQLTNAAGLPLGDHDGRGLSTGKPYISHHPRPLDSSPENRVRALCWWAEEKLLLCGVFESVVACDPATGKSWLLAVPPWEVADPPHRHIESLWLDGDRLHGVLLPTTEAHPEMEGKLFSLDLSLAEVGSAKATSYEVQTYQLQTTGFRLWSSGRAEIVACRYNWLDQIFEPSFIASGYAIGTIAPEYDDLALDTERLLFGNGAAGAFPPYWYVGLPDETRLAWKTTERPWLMGRNLFLPTETRVTASYDEESPYRQAAVTAYRMPGSRGYFVPDGDGYPHDLGNGIPHGSKVGELPLTLPAGYYAFIAHGRPRYHRDDPLEQVARFTLSFSRNSQTPAIAAPLSTDRLLSAEDLVNRSMYSEPLGPLAIVMDGVDEFERLWFRDLATNERSSVSGFGDRTIGIQLARADDQTVYVAYSRLDEAVGSHGRRESRLSLVIGRAVRSGDQWQYTTLHEVNDDSADYAVTALCWDEASRSLHLGVSRQSRHWYTPAGAQVSRVFTEWGSAGGTLVPTIGWVWLDGYFKDDFSIGDRVRLLPAVPENLPYAPLPRTVLAVDWHEGRWTRLQVSPAPDVSDGNLDPALRQILFFDDPVHSCGVEEFWAEFPTQFPDGPPTLQREATAVETAQLLYRYRPNTAELTLLDDGTESLTEELTAKEDGAGKNAVVKLSQPFCQSDSIRLTAGGREVEFTIDDAIRAETGEFQLLIHRRYRGRELSASYRYHDPAQSFDAILSTEDGVYYTRGAELHSLTVGETSHSTNHGAVHHEAVVTASNLVSGDGTIHGRTIYGVGSGGGDLLYQLSTEHSLFVGSREEWQGRGIASCLVELALALGCRFWLDESGRLRFLPRNQEGRQHQIQSWEILDYQLAGGLQGAVTTQRVSWRGGEAISGAASLHGITDEESLHCELLTSQGWAELLAQSLHQQKNHNRRVELLLAGFEPSFRLGDTLTLPLGKEEQQGRIIEITPQLAIEQARTAVVLEQRSALHHAYANTTSD